MSRPLVSVIMPSYNSASFVGDAVRSVQCQTFTEWELLIVDDCSNDQSIALIKDLAARDPRISLTALDWHAGAAVCRNFATQSAMGRYIAYLDADDRWSSNKLEEQLLFSETHKAVAVCAGFERIDQRGVSLGTQLPPPTITYEDLLKANLVPCLTAMYDTTLCGKHYASIIPKRNDYSIWLSVTRRSTVFLGIQEVLAQYRVGSGSLARNKLTNAIANFSLIYQQERAGFAKALYNVGYNALRVTTKKNFSAKALPRFKT